MNLPNINGYDSSSGASNIQSSEIPAEEDEVLHVCSGSKLLLLDSKLLNTTSFKLSSRHRLPQTSSQMLHSLCVDVTVGTKTSPARPFPPQLQQAHPQPDVFLQAPFGRRNDLSGLRHVMRCSNSNEPILPIHPCTVKSGFTLCAEAPMPQQPIAATAWSPVWASRRP